MHAPQIRLVLRLLAEPAADGRLVGSAEVVETGEVVTVRNAGELSELARRLGRGGGEEEDPTDGG